MERAADIGEAAERRFAPAEAERYSPQLLRDLARSTEQRRPDLRFPEPAEQHFRAHLRQDSRGARLTLCLLMATLCLLTGRLDVDEELVDALTLAGPVRLVGLGLLLPIWLLAVLALWRWADRAWGARLIWVAALSQAIALQVLGDHGFLTAAVPPVVLAVLSMMAVLVLGRFRLPDAFGLIAAYFLLMVLINGYLGNGPTYATRHWLLEGLGLSILLLGGLWNEMSNRRAWAAQVLLHAAAGTDFLTGMFNRRAFEQYYQRISLQAQRQGCPLVLALIDVDHFKGYNDRHGHPAGDRALTELGVMLRDFSRRSLDTAARVGGEEFSLVLFDCQLQAALERLERLRRKVEALALPHPDTEAGVLTISLGVVQVGGETPLEVAYAMADEQLYRAKHLGRNRMAAAESDAF